MTTNDLEIITLSSLRAKLVKAIDEKKLAIQYPGLLKDFLDLTEDGGCMNLYPSENFGGRHCHCIIGSVLPFETAMRFPFSPANNWFSGDRQIFIAANAVREKMIDMQEAHDNLVKDYQSGAYSVEQMKKEVEKFFETYVYSLPTEEAACSN